MERKRITQIFPWLLPIRKQERKLVFYLGMTLDKNKYANNISMKQLPYHVFKSSCPMYNEKTGFDMVYQENKVFNLKLAAMTLSYLVIEPQETFSFWKIVRKADDKEQFREGLTVTNGVLTAELGGGLCQMSNLLFWLFLHTPLTIVERHGHRKKDFPEPPSDAPIGVDAAISEGWLDLKVRNDTDISFQIVISFDENNIYGEIFASEKLKYRYEITNQNIVYNRSNDKIFQEGDMVKNKILNETQIKVEEKKIYRNCCEIGYELSENIEVEKRN